MRGSRHKTRRGGTPPPQKPHYTHTVSIPYGNLRDPMEIMGGNSALTLAACNHLGSVSNSVEIQLAKFSFTTKTRRTQRKGIFCIQFSVPKVSVEGLCLRALRDPHFSRCRRSVSAVSVEGLCRRAVSTRPTRPTRPSVVKFILFQPKRIHYRPGWARHQNSGRRAHR